MFNVLESVANKNQRSSSRDVLPRLLTDDGQSITVGVIAILGLALVMAICRVGASSGDFKYFQALCGNVRYSDKICGKGNS